MPLNGHTAFSLASLESVQIMIKLGQSGKCLFPSRLDAYSFTHQEGFVKWYLLNKQSFLVQKQYVFGTNIYNIHIINCCNFIIKYY